MRAPDSQSSCTTNIEYCDSTRKLVVIKNKSNVFHLKHDLTCWSPLDILLKQAAACLLSCPGRSPAVQPSLWPAAAWPTLSGPNASCLIQADCRLFNLIRAIRCLINLQPYPGKAPPVQPCPGQRPATFRRLFDFSGQTVAGSHMFRTAVTCSTLSRSATT